ncbi:hypothetical protein ACFEMC_23305 (plasmid) [Kineococcus sp. DHX-1]|uniref:hypothetical protein n=1 Tax=Kineococcus sp. DHX-1 TaxID=3349638 RepID=UPI0036D235B1
MHDARDELQPAELQEDVLPGGLDAETISATAPPDLNKHRFTLAWLLLALVALFAIGSVIAAILLPTNRFEQAREVIQIVFGPLVTLLGTSFAWYYASSRNSK